MKSSITGPRRESRAPPEHPGYFWLAFEPQNLLISCSKCNKWGGKKNQFPLADEADLAMLCCPNHELENEQPLLLNPYTDIPEQHLHFDAEIGTVESITERGAETIRVCDLNREPLAEKRRESAAVMLEHVDASLGQGKIFRVRSLREEIRNGDVEFAAAVRAELEVAI